MAMHLFDLPSPADINPSATPPARLPPPTPQPGFLSTRRLLSEIVLSLGCIPVAQYGTPGTPELSDALEPLVQNYDAILLANHGVVTCGADLLNAFFAWRPSNICAGFAGERAARQQSCFLAVMWKNCRGACAGTARRPRLRQLQLPGDKRQRSGRVRAQFP